MARSAVRSEATNLDVMARFRNVCFTWNNPDGEIEWNEDKMNYLVYQEEIAPETGTYHFQGYCEFKTALVKNSIKNLICGPGNSCHILARRGTAEEAANYCKKEFNEDGTEKRMPHCEPYEFGTMSQQGKRQDLEGFKDAVIAGKRKRDLIDEHFGIIARYPRFYQTLTEMNRPRRSADLVVTLLYGETGTGKTRFVEETAGADDDFYRPPLTNGTMWFDAYDGQSKVLLDDFAGAASKFTLCNLLQLLDRYPIQVPTKGGHTWWMPNEVFVTTNILPRDWYKWENRGEQYKALARRFHKVLIYYVPVLGVDRCFYEADPNWWQENKPDEAFYS